MYLDVYIGDVDGCSWDPGDQRWRTGNAPSPPSLYFPGGWDLFCLVVRRIESGFWPGMQFDWGTRGARLGKKELSAFLDEQYPEQEAEKIRCTRPFEYRDLKELRRFVAELDPEREYALVACET